jgi:hypothetical protein
MFQLEQQEGEVKHINVRIEKHGTDRVPTVDVKLTCNAANTILDTIEKGLRQSLFRKPGKNDQADFDHDQKAKEAGITDNLVQVKHPGLAPVVISHEFPGYELTIEDAFLDVPSDPDAICLVDATMKGLLIRPIEGGSVELKFTVSAEIETDELSDL